MTRRFVQPLGVDEILRNAEAPQAIRLPAGWYPIDIRRLTEHLCNELEELHRVLQVVLGPSPILTPAALTWAERDAARLRTVIGST